MVNEYLANMDLESIFDGYDIDLCWTRWKCAFLDISKLCVPSATLPEKVTPPWLTKQILQASGKETCFSREPNDTVMAVHFNDWRSKVTFSSTSIETIFFQEI